MGGPLCKKYTLEAGDYGDFCIFSVWPTSSILKYLLSFTFTLNLTIHFIKK
jgi:hypothetical protein